MVGSCGARLVAALLGAALAAASLPAEGGGGASARSGTFRMGGSARVSAGAVLNRTFEVRAGAVVEPGGSPREVRVRIEQGPYRCDLAGEVGEGGALAFAPGQRCALDLQPPDGPGHVDLELVSGSGRLDAERLAVQLACKVSGSVSLQAAGLQVLAPSSVKLPNVPVRGEATATAEGERDHSRAAQR